MKRHIVRVSPARGVASLATAILLSVSHYHSSKELVNAVSAGTMYLHFANGGVP